MEVEKYIENTKKILTRRFIELLHSDNIDKGEILEDMVGTVLKEAYEKGYDVGYNDAMNAASYEFDRERGYL